MERYAIVQNGVVTEVALWDGKSQWANSATAILLPAGSSVERGYTYDGTNFGPPPQPVPTV